VTFVRNFTDIDDKVIKRAAEEGIDAAALTEREIAASTTTSRGCDACGPAHEPAPPRTSPKWSR
jgi:cysteinyl-tRNA synthetase